jgi:hypothetical protein
MLFQLALTVVCWNFLGIHWDHVLYLFDTIKKLLHGGFFNGCLGDLELEKC